MKPATPVTIEKKDRLEMITTALSELSALVQDNQEMERMLKERDGECVPSEHPCHLLKFLSEELRNCTNWIWGKDRRSEESTSTD